MGWYATFRHFPLYLKALRIIPIVERLFDVQR
jgi:hypothetical protein